MAGLSTLQSGPKGSERDQNGQPKCFWPLGTLLGPSGPFWTVSNKNWYFAPKHLCQPLLCPFGAKKSIFPIFQNAGVGAPTHFSTVEVFDDKIAGTSEIPVKDVAAREGWNLMKPLTAKMRPGGYLTGLPDPVVIIYPHSRKKKKGKVIYFPEENRRRYGNLLDRFPEVSDRGPVWGQGKKMKIDSWWFQKICYWLHFFKLLHS